MEKTAEKYIATEKLSSSQIKAQLSSHLEGQSENIQSFHRIMRVLESISFGSMIIIFITALVLSFLWKTIPVAAIPAAWLLLPVGTAILILLIAVHTLVLRAFPPTSLITIFQSGFPVGLIGKSQGFLTGKPAENRGWVLIVVGLIVGVFFAIFAWAVWTVNWSILTPMITVLGVLLGVGIAISVLFNIYQKVVTSR